MPSISCCRSASNYLKSSETWSGQLSVKLEALRSGNMVLGQTSILVIMFIFLNILKAQMGILDTNSIRINKVVFPEQKCRNASKDSKRSLCKRSWLHLRPYSDHVRFFRAPTDRNSCGAVGDHIARQR